MNAIVDADQDAAIASDFAWRSYLLEAKYEFVRMLRLPSFALPTLIFPAMFYLLFGVLLNRDSSDFHANGYMLATYGVFGVMAPGLFGFGVGVASERERGWLTFKRALPMPPGAYLASKLAMAMLFAALTSVVIALLGALLGHVQLAPVQWLMLFVIDLFGVLPFCALGLWIGTLVSAQAAPAIVNLVFLPMAFLSGLWLPLFLLPGFVQTIAPAFPAFHLAQLALDAAGQGGDGRTGVHVIALIAIALVFFALARRRLVRG